MGTQFRKAGQWIGNPERVQRPTVNGANVEVFLRAWHEQRHRARTDLLFLCTVVLGYVDVSMRVHGPIIEALQKFQGAIEQHKTIKDVNTAFAARRLLCEPSVPLWDLPGHDGKLADSDDRKNLILFPRGHLKTTVITIAHTLQWIINYPDIRILISSGTEDQAQKFIAEIKGHFSKNEMFRFLFPEFCPADGSGKEFGNQQMFTVPCRTVARKEATCSIATIGKVLAGGHFEVIKNDDLVDKENCRTASGVEDTKAHFGYMIPLLETNEKQPFHGWVDVAGTRYDFSDLYGAIITTEEKRKAGSAPEYKIVVRSAAPNWPNGPFLWPERMGGTALKQIEEAEYAGPSVLYSQYLQRPIVAGQGLINDEKEIQWVPRKVIEQLYPRYSLYAALDLAGMDSGALGLDNDYSCLAVGGYQRDGRLDIIDIYHGRPSVHEVIEWIFTAFARHPRLIKLKLEKEAHARVLLPFLQREMAQRERWLPVEAQPRDNTQSKQAKIKGLQPWFQNRGIRFAEDLACKSHLLTEVKGFPKYRHDDILDCVVDIMHERDGATADGMGRQKFSDDEDAPSQRDRDEIMERHIYGAANVGIDEQGALDAITGW